MDSGNWKETITDVTPSMSIEPEKELKSPDNSSASVDFPLPIFPLIKWTPSLKVPRAESDHSPRIARTESIVIFIVSTSMTMDNTVCGKRSKDGSAVPAKQTLPFSRYTR